MIDLWLDEVDLWLTSIQVYVYEYEYQYVYI